MSPVIESTEMHAGNVNYSLLAFLRLACKNKNVSYVSHITWQRGRGYCARNKTEIFLQLNFNKETVYSAALGVLVGLWETLNQNYEIMNGRWA